MANSLFLATNPSRRLVPFSILSHFGACHATFTPRHGKFPTRIRKSQHTKREVFLPSRARICVCPHHTPTTGRLGRGRATRSGGLARRAAGARGDAPLDSCGFVCVYRLAPLDRQEPHRASHVRGARELTYVIFS